MRRKFWKCHYSVAKRLGARVLAANLRQFTGRPFLGHGVESLLEEAAPTVVIVTAPAGWGAAQPRGDPDAAGVGGPLAPPDPAQGTAT